MEIREDKVIISRQTWEELKADEYYKELIEAVEDREDLLEAIEKEKDSIDFDEYDENRSAIPNS